MPSICSEKVAGARYCTAEHTGESMLCDTSCREKDKTDMSVDSVERCRSIPKRREKDNVA